MGNCFPFQKACRCRGFLRLVEQGSTVGAFESAVWEMVKAAGFDDSEGPLGLANVRLGGRASRGSADILLKPSDYLAD
jgi:hypothetical protein